MALPLRADEDLQIEARKQGTGNQRNIPTKVDRPQIAARCTSALARNLLSTQRVQTKPPPQSTLPILSSLPSYPVYSSPSRSQLGQIIHPTPSTTLPLLHSLCLTAPSCTDLVNAPDCRFFCCCCAASLLPPQVVHDAEEQSDQADGADGYANGPCGVEGACRWG